MTIGTFLTDMCDEISLLFSEWKFKDEGGEFQKFSVFEQALPVSQGEDDPEPFPYIVVRVEDGGTTSPAKPETARVIFTIGICDESLDNQGHKDVLNVIDRIRQRFEGNQLLKKKYMRLQSEEYPIHWAMPDDDTYPFFFGALEMFFAIPKINTEDSLS